MKQITAQDIIDAYKRHPEIEPIFDHLFNVEQQEGEEWRVTHACAVGILTIDQGLLQGRYPEFPQDEYSHAIDFSSELLSSGALAGLIDGFEARTYVLQYPPSEYERYLAVGAEARAYAMAVLAQQKGVEQ